MVTDESDTPTKHKQTIQRSDLNVLIRFFRCEGTRVAEEINKADCDTTIDVQDKLKKGQSVLIGTMWVGTYSILLRCRDLLNSKCIVQ